ncbi:MAG: DNA-3-methyladenine glycosylase [Acidiferrobacteraceae bacterium]|nr:DNA-3-methyladenine glycosylase [Acidiferrobacteraceae bacterium]|tara:strand:+ start:673 stop:1323 length:651 start_codon:yes stop_codon:yes gene_type:complete
MVKSIANYCYDPSEAVRHIRSVDMGLARYIQVVGEFRLQVNRNRSVFEYLVRSITYQQLTGKAAATIYNRLRRQFPYGRISPDQLLSLKMTELRNVGLSRSKCKALRELAIGVIEGRVPNSAEMHQMLDEEIIRALITIWGVGRWTAEMLLIFYMGRPDILPAGDLGVRKGYQLVRGHRTLPTFEKLHRAGRRWAPYRSVASWYLWRSLEVKISSA